MGRAFTDVPIAGAAAVDLPFVGIDPLRHELAKNRLGGGERQILPKHTMHTRLSWPLPYLLRAKGKVGTVLGNFIGVLTLC